MSRSFRGAARSLAELFALHQFGEGGQWTGSQMISSFCDV